MKLITAYLHCSVKELVASALNSAQFHDVTLQEMPGLFKYGRESSSGDPGSTEIRLSMVCPATDVVRVTEIIRTISDTNPAAECWIRVSDIAQKNSEETQPLAAYKFANSN